MKQFYVRDPRKATGTHGDSTGVWLKLPPSPALWVPSREQAQTFTVDEISFLKKCYPYLEGCEFVPSNDEDANP